MQLIESRAEWRAACERARRAGSRLGLVPTMGALHDGHRSLVVRAAAECDQVAASIFVNPIQFGDAADLERYPRSLAADLEVLEGAGCDLVFAPSVTEMYPQFPALPTTSVRAGGLALGFEGSDRPGHFDGVATVVLLLLNLTTPDLAYFGEKDFQQVCVVRQMVADLGLSCRIVGCPIIREDDGLALSSRNARLSPDGRRAALSLSRALEAGAAQAAVGATLDEVEAAMTSIVRAQPGAGLFYAAVVDPMTLERPAGLLEGQELRLLVAADVEGVRLIDNAGATVGRVP
jgi:pantoate--beta-alanine ligase